MVERSLHRRQHVVSVIINAAFFVLLGAFFASARRYISDVPMSILTLVDHAQSPAVASLRRCISVLSDHDHGFWIPMVGAGRGWSADCFRMAAVPMLLMVGTLHRRFVQRLDTWPCRLCLLLVGSAAEKLAIVRELQSREECCLDSFSLKVKDMCVGIESADPLPPHLVRFVSDVFENIAVTNIRCVFFCIGEHAGLSEPWECTGPDNASCIPHVGGVQLGPETCHLVRHLVGLV